MSRQAVKTEAKLRLGDRLESALKLTGIHQAAAGIVARPSSLFKGTYILSCTSIETLAL